MFFLLKDGKTPLHCAAENYSEEVMKILVDHGANPDIRDAVLILSFFFWSFCLLIVLFLFKVGWSPLLCAISDDSDEVAKFLVEHGADVNLQDSNERVQKKKQIS